MDTIVCPILAIKVVLSLHTPRITELHRCHAGFVNKELIKIICAGKAERLRDPILRIIGFKKHFFTLLQLFEVNKLQKSHSLVPLKEPSQLLGADVTIRGNLLAREKDVIVVLHVFLALRTRSSYRSSRCPDVGV